MYQALYRKWRPKTFDDVIGQKHITETLKNEVCQGKLSHAYLFTGTRGTGKTTCAKILSKAANCENPVNGNPCNCCPSCIGIDDGSIMDVLEIDAASNNGVDNIRSIRDEAVYTPGFAKKRVYIIDEVHMLSQAAFNALLKIMEEPPDHLIFVLATTEFNKVPSTILSRCQSFTFKRITPTDIGKRIEYICANENISITSQAVDTISRMADGSVRDALSLLDQCSSGGGTVDENRVQDVLGLVGHETIEELFKYIIDKNTGEALSLLNQIYNSGKDISAVFEELSSLARDILVNTVARKNAANLITGSYSQDSLKNLSSRLTVSQLVYISSSIQDLLRKLTLSTNQRIDAELCIVSLCEESIAYDMKAFSSRLTRLEMAVSRGTITTTQEQVRTTPECEDSPLEISDPPNSTKEQNSPDVGDELKYNCSDDTAQWPEILSVLKTQLSQIEFAHLSNDRAVKAQIVGDKIVISFNDKLVNKVLNKPNVKELINNAANHVLKRNVKLIFSSETNSTSGDKFSELLKLVEKFDNIKIK